MNKLRLLLLMVVLVMLIAPLKFTGSADRLRGRGSDSQESSIYGNVKIRGTQSGHITVAVDKSFPIGGIIADGEWDVLFHFATKKNKPGYQDIAFDLEGATVSFTSRRLTVLSAERHILLNLSLEKEPQSNNLFSYHNDRSLDLPETVRITRGLALGQYRGTGENVEGLWLCGTEGGTCSLIE